MDPNLTWDLILDLIALRGTQFDHLECSRIAVGDVAGVTAWVYIVQWIVTLSQFTGEAHNKWMNIEFIILLVVLLDHY